MSDHEEIQAVLERFTAAVQSGNAGAVCGFLAGRASALHGCGNPELEDINPQVQLGIDSINDLQIEQITPYSATVSFPHAFTKLRGERGRRRQALTVMRVGDEWKISDFQYGQH